MSNNLRSEIVLWMRKYLIEAGKDGFVLGLSGGIDSSVIALLGQEAVKDINKGFLALLLPIKVNHVDYYDEQIAKDIVKNFSIPYERIDITPSYQSFIKILGEQETQVCYTNLKARLRMATVYFYANKFNYLVLGTVNKAEFYIGYFPKNASAGDIMPIGDLLKKDIRLIAKSYGLPEYIVHRKASGCIWANTAEEEWGITEDELDKIIEIYEEFGEEYLHLNFDAKKVELFLKKYKESEHKRRFYPIWKKEKME